MALHGFGVLAPSQWSAEETAKLNKYFKGKASDWNKRTLADLRHVAKESLLLAQAYRCAYCRMPIEDRLGYCEIDHVVSKESAPGFCYTRLNLVLTCKRCNQRKGRHNPTTLTLAKLASCKRYFRSSKRFVWVHPYFHDYDAHIEIKSGYIFAVRDGSPEGAAVIKACGLDRMSAVAARAKFARSMAAKDDVAAVLSVVGGFPDESPAELANVVKKRGIKMPVAEIEEIILRIRAHDLASMLATLRGSN